MTALSDAAYVAPRIRPTAQRDARLWLIRRHPWTLLFKAAVFRRWKQEFLMLHYAVVFFVIALVAALFGFGGIAAGAVEIGKLLFIVFAVLAVISFVVSLVRRR